MVNIFNAWKAALLVGAGLILFAACTIEEPAEPPRNRVSIQHRNTVSSE